jgi:hypothetical protein
LPDELAKSIVRVFLQFKAFLILCIMAGVCGLLVFGPNIFLDDLGLASVAHKWRGAFSLILIAVSVPIVYWVDQVLIRQVLDKREGGSRIKDYIRNAGRDQAIILLKIAGSGKTPVELDPLDHSVQSLVQAGVLRRIPSSNLESVYGPTDLAAPYLRRERLRKLLPEKYESLQHPE